ncbi:MAG: hypothetical protein RLZZ227_3059 [Pseudomonadota bacterium]
MKHRISESKKPQDEGNIPFWRVVLSVMQASFGVQNRANRERDFKQGNWVPFMIAALLFTAVFVGVLVIVVRSVIAG